jgi:uncharacterized protein YlxW (UPF0749 family)
VKPTKAHYLITVVCFVLGMMLVTQFRSVQYNNWGTVPSLQRMQELTSQLKSVMDERDLLKKEVAELQARIADFETSASKVSGLTEVMQKELEKARMSAGLIAGTGPGIEIILDDSNVPKQPGEDPNLFLVHDEDILKVVNELFASGAEAVSVNGQRIISTSEIRCVGPTVVINSVRLAPPFTIHAIGNPDALETSLKMRGGIIESLQVFGIKVNITKQENIKMPAYDGPVSFKYLKPVKAGDLQ